MNAKELREAAQRACDFSRRIIGVIEDHGEELRKYDVVGDNVICANHILETVRDDDDEPADASWQMDIAVANGFLPYTETFLYDVWTGGHGKTRGQFRKLCEGLGITLEEAT